MYNVCSLRSMPQEIGLEERAARPLLVSHPHRVRLGLNVHLKRCAHTILLVRFFIIVAGRVCVCVWGGEGVLRPME